MFSLKNFFILSIGNLFPIISSFVMLKFVTSHYTISEYGNLAIVLGVSTVLAQIITGPLSASILRYYSLALFENALPELVSSINKIIKDLTQYYLFLLPIILIISYVYDNFIIEYLYTYCCAIIPLYISFFQASLNKKIIITVQIFELVIKILACIIVEKIYPTTAPINIYAISNIFTLVYYFFIIKIKYKNINESEKWRLRLIEYAVPFMKWGIPNWIFINSDKWLLSIFYDKNIVGMYSVVQQLSTQLISLASNLVTQYSTPVIYLNSKSKQNLINRAIIQVMFFQSFLGFVLIMVYVFFGNEIISFFTATKYNDVNQYLSFFIISSVIFNLAQTYCIKYSINMKVDRLLIPKLVYSVIGILTNILFIYNYGIWGAGIAIMISTTIFFIHIVKVHKNNL